MTTCCTMDDCEKPSVGRGWGWMHWRRWRRHGNASYDPPTRRPAAERFWQRVDKTSSASGCWLWMGYPYFTTNGVQRGAHIWAYEDTGATIPPTYEVIRTCRSPLCVNPDHLECLPNGERTRRNLTKTHCKHGHSLHDAYESTTREGWRNRHCKICRQEQANNKRKGVA